MLRCTVSETSKFVMQNKQNRYINTRTSKQNYIRIIQLSVIIPDAVLIQFDLLRMSKILLETCKCTGL